MPTYIKKPRLSERKKETIISYLFGEISQEEAARVCGIARQNFPSIPSNILRALVMEGKIDIGKLLKNF